MCVFQAGVRHDALPEARQRLRTLGAGSADRPWPTLVLAHLALFSVHRAEAIALYETAAEGFARSGQAEGEVIARENLARQSRVSGDVEAAARHVTRANQVAEASQHPLVIARAAVLDASHVMDTGGDIGRARRVLVRADRITPPTAPIGLRRQILLYLAKANIHVGQIDDALETLERHRRLASEDGSPQGAAVVEHDSLVVKMTLGISRPRPGLRSELVAQGESAVARAHQLGNPAAVAGIHQLLADLLRTTEPGRATVHLRRCLEIESGLKFPGLRARCLLSLAEYESTRHHGRAERLGRTALALARLDGDHVLLADVWRTRLRVGWRTLSEQQAVEQSMDALDAIERLRNRQTGETERAALFGYWAPDYRWLVGRLLQTPSRRLADALAVGERLRARVLIEQLARVGVASRVTDEREATRIHVTAGIAEAQRELLMPSLGPIERRRQLDRIHLLELDRQDLQNGGVPPLTFHDVSFASLEDIQRTLDEREAMVWFSIAPWRNLHDEFGGGSWAIAISRHAHTIHPLPVDTELDAQVAAFVGLLRDGRTADRRWAPAARRLGEALLGDVVAHLPAGVTRLTIVTDAALPRLPFDTLSVDDGPRIGERFEISVTPSATVWLHQREVAKARRGDGVLVLADPQIPRGSPDGILPLTALPGARQEARMIASRLSLPRRRVVTGSAASERLLKQTPLGEFGIVHFAAHARADAAYPERSTIFLAPGNDTEDGWLQPHEISALDLRGAVVVLSACDSAEGSLIPGEGPLSLARAFFAGGASAVVAARWPLRDDDGARLMGYFYRALSEGQTLAAAMRDARRRAENDGLPPAAWAGVVVLGNGGQVPVPALTAHPIGALWTMGTTALIAVCGWGIWRRRRTMRRRGAFTPRQ